MMMQKYVIMNILEELYVEDIQLKLEREEKVM